MYKAIIVIRNLNAGVDQTLDFQFDPATFSADDWNAAFPLFQDAIAKIQVLSVNKDPVTWSNANPDFQAKVAATPTVAAKV